LKSSANLLRSSPAPIAACLLLLAVSLLAGIFVSSQGWTLWYGDAQAHLSIARRIIDARAPGYEQIGTVWLPLPHIAMLPFIGVDSWWRSGLAGVIPSAACFVLAGLFLFLAARRLFGVLPAWAALLAFALNPNLLYLQSTPMTESMALCFSTGLLYFCARFHRSRATIDAAAAGLMACLGTLTRYEAWFLIPFVAVYILLAGGANRFRAALVFCLCAGAGPLYWLAHNAILYSNALEFYNGEWSAKAIYQRALDRGMAKYPGDHDWPKAWEYYRAAAELCLGKPLLYLGVAGLLAALWKRAWWAVILLALTPAFYVLSLYSSGTPIFVPHLWPNSYYNTRYGINALPLACLGLAAIAAILPRKTQAIAAVLLALAAVTPWLLSPKSENWICWKESQVNSVGRRTWTHAAAEYLQPRYKHGAGIFMSFGDPTGILREAGIPLKESLHEGDGPLWQAAVARPDLFLWPEWGIAISGDRASQALNRLRRGPRRYECVRTFTLKDSPVIEIWRHIQ